MAKPRQCVCRDCGLKQVRQHNDFLHAAVPRCSACGGQLDRTMHKTAVKPKLVTKESDELKKKRLGLRKKKKKKRKKGKAKWNDLIKKLPKNMRV